jgi:hypothetical protein
MSTPARRVWRSGCGRGSEVLGGMGFEGMGFEGMGFEGMGFEGMGFEGMEAY